MPIFLAQRLYFCHYQHRQQASLVKNTPTSSECSRVSFSFTQPSNKRFQTASEMLILRVLNDYAGSFFMSIKTQTPTKTIFREKNLLPSRNGNEEQGSSSSRQLRKRLLKNTPPNFLLNTLAALTILQKRKERGNKEVEISFFPSFLLAPNTLNGSKILRRREKRLRTLRRRRLNSSFLTAVGNGDERRRRRRCCKQ